MIGIVSLVVTTNGEKNMKTTLNEWQIADALKRDDNAAWTYEGAKALASYLFELDEQTGEDTELDVVAIRCEWSEYESAQDAASHYQWEFDGDEEEIEEEEPDDEREESALQFLQDRTEVIEFSSGIIIREF